MDFFKKKYNPPLKSQLFCCKRHKQRGDDYFRKYNFLRAIKEYGLAIYCHDDPLAYQNRALCYLKKTGSKYNPYAAMLDMKEALKFNKDESYDRKTKLLYLYSTAWCEMGSPFKAEMWFSKIQKCSEL